MSTEGLQGHVQEPTKHQYDWDVATTMGFLHQYGLSDEFKLNVECNHATLAGHSCDHELRVRTPTASCSCESPGGADEHSSMTAGPSRLAAQAGRRLS